MYFIIGTVEYIKRYNLTPGLKAFVRRRKRQIVFAILGGINCTTLPKQATVFMAFHKAMELGGIVPGPKKLGTFGASYLYPIFVRLGVINAAAR